MHFHSHPLSLVYLSFNLCPSLHTQTCLKLVRSGSKFAVNTRLSWGLLKSLSASVRRCDVFLYLARLVVSAARRSLCGNHCLLCRPLPPRKSRWLSLTLCDCGCLRVIAPHATAASARERATSAFMCWGLRQRERDYAVQWMKCVQSPAWKRDQEREAERDSRGVCVRVHARHFRLWVSFWAAHTLLIFFFFLGGMRGHYGQSSLHPVHLVVED